MAEHRTRMALCAPRVIADPKLAHLVGTHGTRDVWKTIRRQGGSTSLERRTQGVDPEALEVAIIRSGTGFLVPGGKLWPDTLSDLGMCQLRDQGGQPLGPWVAGSPELLRMLRAVAIVGARAATGYGLHVTGELAAGLSASGWLMISELAFGIDSTAHHGALEVGGLTLAVMTTGVDGIYPAGHHGLRSQIRASSAVITELASGTHPLWANFLGRNQLIAALGSSAVVVEAGAHSGAHNIISWAAELDRVTMAVPGPVASSPSVAPHHLIRESIAMLVTSATDVTVLLSPLGTQEELSLRGEDRPINSLFAPLRTVRKAVPTGTTLGATELAVATRMTVPEVITAAAGLTELGWLENIGSGWQLPGG